MKNLLNTLWLDDNGQDLVEYAMITALLTLVAIGTISVLGDKIAATWTAITNKLVVP